MSELKQKRDYNAIFGNDSDSDLSDYSISSNGDQDDDTPQHNAKIGLDLADFSASELPSIPRSKFANKRDPDAIKRIKERTKAKKLKKHRKALGIKEPSSEDETGNIRPDDSSKNPNDIFEQALAAVKNTVKRRKNDYDEAAMDVQCADLRRKMLDCADRDVELNRLRQPATSKLDLLPEVISLCKRGPYSHALLENDILLAFRVWLEPLPDTSLPALEIRRSLMEIMDRLPIDGDHLRESKVGRIIVFYGKVPREIPELQTKAQKLAAKWAQPILNRGKIARGNADRSIGPLKISPDSFERTAREHELLVSPTATTQKDKASETNFTRVPMTQFHQFSVVPKSTAAASGKKKDDDTMKRLKSRMTRIGNSSGGRRPAM